MSSARWRERVAGCRAAAVRLLRSTVRALPEPIRHRVRTLWLWVQVAVLHRTPSPVRPPGEGPIVGLDARARAWPDVAKVLAARSGRSERLVVVTDQPVMHLARSVRGVIEFVPHNDDPGFGRDRLAEIGRVYDVERWEPFPDDPSEGGL